MTIHKKGRPHICQPSIPPWRPSFNLKRGVSRTAGLLGVSVLLALSACGGAGTQGANQQGGSNGSATANVQVPSHYPSEYQKIIAGSKEEGGDLTIYSSIAADNWRPVLQGFKKKYPWISDISTNNLDTSQMYQRYYSEAATDNTRADLMAGGTVLEWPEFVERGHALKYESPELKQLPDFAMPLQGVYNVSLEPLLTVYNKQLLEQSQYPTGLGKLANLIERFPEKFGDDKVTTYDARAAYGLSMNMAYVEEVDNAWRSLETILPAARVHSSSGQMLPALGSGQYLAGYFVTSTSAIPAVRESAGVLGWSYAKDGQPVMPRGIAITEGANNPNTAKLFVDYLLSKAGQTAVYEGGMTPYRKGLEVDRSYWTMVEKVGKEDVIRVPYESISESQRESFRDRWVRLLNS